MRTIITKEEEIRKFFYEKGLDFLTSVPRTRMQEIILSSIMKGNTGKTKDYAELGHAHRTTYGHFLSKGIWDDARVEETQKRESLKSITELAKQSGEAMYISIDDTVNQKKRPSPKAKKPMEGAGWYYSHLEGRIVWGHQIHAAIVSSGTASLCYSLRRCRPESGSKIEMALDVIRSLPVAGCESFLLIDSWYTNSTIVNACVGKNYHVIGALKTNRILYPEGKRSSIKDFARSLTLGCFHPVTVKGHDYCVYRYEGSLNKIDHAVVLITYPKESFGIPSALKAFLCSDSSLTDAQILTHYTHRWKIEVFFKQQKYYFGFDSYMVRSARAVDRLLLILSVAHFFCVAWRGFFFPFGDSVRLLRSYLCS